MKSAKAARPALSWMLVQALVSVFLLVFLLRGFDWTSFFSLFCRISPLFYLLSLVLVVASQAIYAFRWHMVARAMGIGVPFGVIFQHYLIGIFFNNFLPTSMGGDAARIYYLGRNTGYVKAGASVVFERYLGFLSIAALATVFSWMLNMANPVFQLVRNMLSAGFVIMAVILAAILLLPVQNIGAWVRRLGGRMEEVGGKLESAFCSVREISGRGRLLAGLLALVFVYFALFTGLYGLFFKMALGTGFNFPGIMTVLLAISILSNIPLSLNGIGLREQLHYLLFASLGIPKEAAVSISLLIFANLLVVSLMGCHFWLAIRKRNAAG